MTQEGGPSFLALVENVKSRIRQIGIAEVKQMWQEGEPFLLVDVREDSEWAEGHAAGALHLSKGIIERDIEARVPGRDTRMVLYCGGGLRSVLAADNLRQMGYTDVLSLDGGWVVFRRSGLPLDF
jgi:rhodanese-related sulfurtransferase